MVSLEVRMTALCNGRTDWLSGQLQAERARRRRRLIKVVAQGRRGRMTGLISAKGIIDDPLLLPRLLSPLLLSDTATMAGNTNGHNGLTTAQMKRPVIGRGLSSPYAPLPPTDLPSLLIGLLFQIYTIFIEPILCHVRITRPGGSDPTYGRSKIPPNAFEKHFVLENPRIKYRHGKTFISSKGLSKGNSWDKEGDAFVAYTTFWCPEAIAKCGFTADVVLLHGINDHGAKLAPHGHKFAQAGFRVILVDLPTFGNSSGLHAYIPSLKILIEAVHAVLFDVRDHDLAEQEGGPFVVTDTRRKLFLEGHSMGGFTALYYAALYPPATEEELKNGGLVGDKWRPHIDGVAVAAPMIGISPECECGAIPHSMAP